MNCELNQAKHLGFLGEMYKYLAYLFDIFFTDSFRMAAGVVDLRPWEE